MARAKLRRIQSFQLAAQHEPLIVGEPMRRLRHASQTQTTGDEPLDVHSRVCRLELLGRSDAHARRERHLCTAAAGDRPTAVMDAREEAQLQRIGYMTAVGERTAPPSA